VNTDRRLFRSPTDRVLAGVAGGMAETYDIDPSLVRLVWAVLILFTGGVFLVVYAVMAFVIPLSSADAQGPGLWTAPPAGEPAGPAEAEAGAPPPGTTTGWTPPARAAASAPRPMGGYRRAERRSDGAGALVLGAILIIVGGFFLLRQFIPALNLGFLWPVLVIIGGVLLIATAMARNSRR
jgi:phage shock protein C